jgi:hypothetical protein
MVIASFRAKRGIFEFALASPCNHFTPRNDNFLDHLYY